MGTSRTQLFLLASTVAISTAALAIEEQASPLPRVQLTDLVYQGAFRLPRGTFGFTRFDYGGYPIAYNAERDSLFVLGHVNEQGLAEVSIPEAVNSTRLEALQTARVLQPFADVLEGRAEEINPDDGNRKRIGGVLPYRGKLIIAEYAYYDAAQTQVNSHWVSGSTLATKGDLQGPFRVGKVGAGFVSGYLADVPANLQAMLGGPVVTGQCCINIIKRTSYGPALFAIDPDHLGTKDPVPAEPLVYYPSDRFVNDWDVQSTFFNGSTHVRGVVIPAGTRSVLFFGRHGLGPFCYGTGEDCHDPVVEYKGTHAYPYVSYIWAYDALDLAAVKAGRKRAWAVRPYATWTLNLPFPGRGDGEINGATFDPRTARLFVSQAYGDDPLPLVHVFRVSSATPTTATSDSGPRTWRDAPEGGRR